MNEEEIDDDTARIVYEEIGVQHDKIEKIIESYERNGMTHTESYENMQSRAMRLREMRGLLRRIANVERE